jgi:mannose-6-phosphate isomerase-like protein (cupin superfamily)
MNDNVKYVIHENVQFDFLELIDVQKLIKECSDDWYNQTLCKVNDCVVRLGVFKQGIFHWHKHEAEDEFFFVLKGKLVIELEKREIVLNEHQGCTIPKGIAHRPRVVKCAAVIMVEGSTVKPIGD